MQMIRKMCWPSLESDRYWIKIIKKLRKFPWLQYDCRNSRSPNAKRPWSSQV